MLSKTQQLIKRVFDLFFSFIGIIFLTIPIIMLGVIASVSTQKNGIFKQERIGQHEKPFNILKIRSMITNNNSNHITIKNDARITPFGRFIRKYHLDELPQIYNVFIGDMSFVGPRPDVKGYADLLQGDNRIILSVKPGITGPATLTFRNEEALLATQKNPKKFNDEVLWVKKVAINKQYVKNWSLINDIIYILKTLF